MEKKTGLVMGEPQIWKGLKLDPSPILNVLQMHKRMFDLK